MIGSQSCKKLKSNSETTQANLQNKTKQRNEKRLKLKVSGYKSQSKQWSIAGCRLLLRTLSALLAQAIKALNGTDGNLFCHDTGSIQGWSIFISFLGLLLYLFKNQNIYYNKNVLSRPLKVIVYIRIASKSAFERFTHKDAACKTEAFLHTLFLENEVQTDQKNYGTMLFMSKQVSLPKISLILQKVKISPKTDICPFCMKAFNCPSHVKNIHQSLVSKGNAWPFLLHVNGTATKFSIWQVTATSWTLLLSCTGINMIYSPENMQSVNEKQKVLFCGKQLKDNT